MALCDGFWRLTYVVVWQGEGMANVVFSAAVAARNCLVTITDFHGVRHTAEVSAESVYEAGVLGLAALKCDSWVDPAGRGTTLEVLVSQPPVKHAVTVAQIERWLEETTSSPREKIRKERLKAMLSPGVS